MDPAALVVLTTTLPRSNAVDDSAVGVTPVPDSDAVSGLFEALVVTVSVPAGAAPWAVGVMTADMVQLAPGCRTSPVQVDMETA